METMTEQELSFVKGGQWVYWEGKWYWIDEAR